MTECREGNLALATTLLAWEVQQPATDPARAIESAFRRLHDVMSPIVGSAGYCALLLRAVHLTKREHPWVALLVVSAPPFALLHLAEQVSVVGTEPALRGGAALLATLLDLFCTFIGEELTLRQVRRVWTDLPAGDAHASSPKETT